ncbi:T9SS sorting signal type C domain-containing protein [Flavobacterium zepuense]|uniref:T9SS sorting signal type C domain-containing protein n=1 Tax=Flavobacterium zepuense TaxID=2593302 RepID=A0A552UWC6_9FLAO|nr:T9SS sorting signal type C domain-containing protein [Flavobacterium zepuense]TRW22541.1 T9SS sorting signal type C domain-containing protein [Flavobacterium zepuense]
MKSKITLLKSCVLLALLQVPAAGFASNSEAHLVSNSKNSFPAIASIASQIVTQPQSAAACLGESAQFTVVADVTGSAVYSWQKNGVLLSNGGAISGADTPTLTITNITANDAAAYRCMIVDLSGAQYTNDAYLNTTIAPINDVTTCLNVTSFIQAEAQGAYTQYQWYASASADSNTGGTLIANANASSYSPAVNNAGTTYYYVEAYPASYQCAKVTSNVVAFTVTASAAGTVSDNEFICPGETVVVTLTGYNGTIQWQQSLDGLNNWQDVTGGTGATTGSYTTPALVSSTYYRAQVTSNSCGVVYSDTVGITVSGVFVWIGADNTDWNTADNWSCSMVPTKEQHVIIPSFPAYQPVITGATALAKSLTIDEGASVTVTTGATLNVSKDVSVDDGATLLIQNNAALVQDDEVNNSGLVVVKKNSNPLFRLDYTMWSSPVSGQPIGTFSPFTVSTRFYTYDGASDQYATLADLTQNFEPATAYLIRMPNSITGTATGGYYDGTDTHSYQGNFTGTPHNGTINVTPNTLGNRYMAVGNPYPSPISVKEFFEQNAGVLDSLSGFYMWRKKNDGAVSTYCTLTMAGLVANAATSETTGEDTEGYMYGGQDQSMYYDINDDNANWMISAGQGFIVRAKEDATGQLTFNNSMRRAAAAGGNQSFFKGAQNNAATASRLWVNIKGAGSFSQTAIAYIDGATTGLDYGYDGARLTDNGSTELYTTVANKNLAIQARPAFTSSDVVAMGYKAIAAGEFTIALDHFDGVFAQGQDVFIKDNLLNATHNLSEGAYTFTTDAGTFANRFEILYMPQQALDTNEFAFDANSVIVYQKDGVVNITSGTAIMNNVTVYDISGRKLYGQSDINNTNATISGLKIQQEVIIVEINTEKGRVAKKIIL